MMKTCARVALVAVVMGAMAFGARAAGEVLDYEYTVDRRDVEKRYGGLKDGKLGEGIWWHTKFVSRTTVVCELKETCELDRIELHVPKHTRWYIVKELQVSLDDGLGEFGDPFVLKGLAPSAGGTGDRDPSCTNHLFVVERPGNAVRVKVTVVSDAVGCIGELRMIGRSVASTASKSRPSEKSPVAKGRHKRLENRQWKVAFDPVGGRVASLYSKAFGFELTDTATLGAFSDEAWDRPRSHGFLAGKPYQLTAGAGKGLSLTAVGNAQGGGVDFLRVEKRYSASDDSTAFRVDYRFVNIPEAMAAQSYAPFLRAALGVAGQRVTCFYPTADGIVALKPGERGGEYWGHRPVRGWMASVAADGAGVALTFPAADVKAFYSWYGEVPTLDWRMVPVLLDCDEGYDVRVEVLPFKGLGTVSGAGGGLVGELADGVCRVVSSRAGTVVAKAGETSTKLVFGKPGELQSFETDAKTVQLLLDGREACRLEAAPKSGDWKLEPLVASRETKVATVDLNCYTNFPSTGATAWGKPLPGKRLRATFVTGLGNQLEIGRLAERFDMDYRTAPVSVGAGDDRKIGDPVFSYGDYFAQVGVADSVTAVKRALDWDCQVIVISGIPFGVLPEDVRKTVLDKVRAGAGLVLIGADRDVSELGLKLSGKPVKRLGAQASGEAFADVPFALLGEERVSAFAAEGATVHATCADRPYLTEQPFGKGRVFNLAYDALVQIWPWYAPGLTPDLLDFYPDRIAPAEQYYSLIAKVMLAAGGKRLPVRLGAATVTAAEAAVPVTSGVAGPVVLDWAVRNAFGDVLRKGRTKHELAKGGSVVRIPLSDVPAFSGPLAFSLVVRARKGVLSWGEWAFAHAPAVEVTAVKLDEPYRREGETVKVEVKTRGLGQGARADVTLRLRLVDSFGRLVAERRLPAEATATVPFEVRNELAARCYDVVAELEEKGVVVSRRRAELRVRPSREKLMWNDFEAGVWGNADTRMYLSPALAASFRDAGVVTVIANPFRGEVDFAMRYAFNPTYLSGAGLSRSSDVSEYLRTGDKMKLTRPTCLSSPKFFEGRDKSIAREIETLPRYGLRFVWFGDEQSLTGYGGDAIDYCFSEHCLKEMRSFAQGRYGTLERLNEEWETAFKTWDEVVPFTRQEVWEAKGRHVAGWADHLEFMDGRLTNTLAYSCRKLHEVDPDMRFALSGTQAPSAYGGMDWWKQLGVLDCAMSYGGGGQHDIHRSFAPDGCFMPWKWGYGGAGEAAVASVWTTAFLGCRGIMGFHSKSMWRPDMTQTRGVADTAPHVLRLVQGVGKHLVNNLAVRPEVAILYSQASIRAAFIENRVKQHNDLQEKYRQILRHLGASYDYVAYEQLATGVLMKRGYRMLLLADATAMSDAEVAAVREFAAKGGLVCAEGTPAVRQANCRKRPAPALADVFANPRNRLVAEIDTAYMKAIEYPDNPVNTPAVDGQHALVVAALKAAGIDDVRLGVADAATGQAVRNADVYPWADRAGNSFWGVIAPVGKVRDAVFTFPRKGWTYDLVSGRCYGEVRRLTLPLRQGAPYAFVQLPERQALAEVKVAGRRVDMRASTKADTVFRVRVFRPDGSEAAHYAKNVLAKGGVGACEVPFALSDAAGDWRVEVTEIIGGDRKTAVCRK